MKVTASCKFNDHDLTDIPVLNPDGWFGKTWLLELGGCYTPLFLVVEADSLSDAIDELRRLATIIRPSFPRISLSRKP